MFWLGMIAGTVVGVNIGVMLMALFKMNKN